MKQTNQVLYFSVFTISHYCIGYLENLKDSEKKTSNLTELSSRLGVSINKLNIIASEAFKNEFCFREEEAREFANDLDTYQLDIESFRNEIGDDWEMFLDNID